ncbi:hypothetical protein ES705_23606 [subsurface metagenome]
MKYICETLFRLKELLQLALKMDDTKLRKQINKLISDMDEANQEVDCLDDLDIEKMNEKKSFNYFS